MNYSEDRGEVDIKKNADIQQNGDPSDDVYVHSITPVNQSLTVLYQPIPIFAIGYGKDSGTITFDETDPQGKNSNRRFNYEQEFYSMAITVGFTGTAKGLNPIVTIYTKIPKEKTEFSGNIRGVGLGLFYGW